MSQLIRAIETRYQGYRFRSRLEARWAVFFDALGIRWEYEPEGFELGNGQRYLPDFHLPKFHDPVRGTYVEVKPIDSGFEKAREFGIEYPILLACGAPGLAEYELIGVGGGYPVVFYDKYLPGGRNESEYRFYTCPEDVLVPEDSPTVHAASDKALRAFRWRAAR